LPFTRTQPNGLLFHQTPLTLPSPITQPEARRRQIRNTHCIHNATLRRDFGLTPTALSTAHLPGVRTVSKIWGTDAGSDHRLSCRIFAGWPAAAKNAQKQAGRELMHYYRAKASLAQTAYWTATLRQIGTSVNRNNVKKATVGSSYTCNRLR
jgi:hypothetical protein